MRVGSVTDKDVCVNNTTKFKRHNKKRRRQMKKKIVLPLALTMLLMGFLRVNAAEEPSKYPSKPIRYIVIFGAGGGTDVASRKLCELAEPILGQPITVVNKAGGGGSIGIAAIAKAKPDGYTIGAFTQSSTVLLPHLREVPYNTKKDFAFICEFLEYLHAFCVRSDSPWKTFKDLIKDAKDRPGKLTYGSTGPKSHIQLYSEQVFAKEKVKLTHVPFKGSAALTTAILGGHINCGLSTSNQIPHLKSGKLRALAVDTKDRWDFLPDVPTFEELGHHIDMPTFAGVVGPSGIPKEILSKLRNAFSTAAQDPSFQELIRNLKMAPVFLPGEEFEELVFRAYDKNGEILKGSN